MRAAKMRERGGALGAGASENLRMGQWEAEGRGRAVGITGEFAAWSSELPDLWTCQISGSEISSFSCLLSTYCVPHSMLGTRETKSP